MQNHQEIRYEDFWKASGPGHAVAEHPIVQYVTYNRLVLITRRLRLYDPDSVEAGIPHSFSKVNEWPDIQQATSTAFFEPGTNIAVDEGIIQYQGRMRCNVHMRDKPEDGGINVWQLLQQGYLLCWIWHVPSEKFGPVGVEYRTDPPVKNPPEPHDLAALKPSLRP
jgi:hypothetical protein